VVLASPGSFLDGAAGFDAKKVLANHYTDESSVEQLSQTEALASSTMVPETSYDVLGVDVCR